MKAKRKNCSKSRQKVLQLVIFTFVIGIIITSSMSVTATEKISNSFSALTDQAFSSVFDKSVIENALKNSVTKSAKVMSSQGLEGSASYTVGFGRTLSDAKIDADKNRKHFTFSSSVSGQSTSTQRRLTTTQSDNKVTNPNPAKLSPTPTPKPSPIPTAAVTVAPVLKSSSLGETKSSDKAKSASSSEASSSDATSSNASSSEASASSGTFLSNLSGTDKVMLALALTMIAAMLTILMSVLGTYFNKNSKKT